MRRTFFRNTIFESEVLTIKKQNKWNVSEDIRQRMSSYIKKLNYDLQYAEDRCELVRRILEEDRDFWTEYLSSKSFRDKQIKNKNSILAENDFSLVALSIMADYLVFPKFKNQEEQQQHEIRKSLKSSKVIPVGGIKDIHKIVQKNKSINYRNKKQMITKQDLIDFKDLQQINNVLIEIEKLIGRTPKERKEKQQENLKKYGHATLRKLKRIYNDLKRDMIIIKEKLRGTIYFKRATKGTTKITFEEDTGYYNESGDYIEVSENRIDFGKADHISALLNYYSQLKQRFYDDINSEMWAILLDLDNLIENTKLRDFEREILILKIDKMPNDEISKILKEKYDLELSNVRISQIFNEEIPKKIVETYRQQREDWIFTFKVKGEYKKCSKCGEVKLTKYFSPKKDSKDGYHSYCRNCR